MGRHASHNKKYKFSARVRGKVIRSRRLAHCCGYGWKERSGSLAVTGARALGTDGDFIIPQLPPRKVAQVPIRMVATHLELLPARDRRRFG